MYRKKFGNTAWGKRWIECIESIGDSNRMSRGRAYARSENVHNVDIQLGKITAKVKGNYGTYKISITFDKFKEPEIEQVFSMILSDSEVMGSILSNELHDKLTKKLVPMSMSADCSCPDYENPCKHIAAVYYVLSDEIDAAPQILFTFRGISMDQLRSRLMHSQDHIARVPKEKPAKGKDTAGQEKKNLLEKDKVRTLKASNVDKARAKAKLKKKRHGIKKRKKTVNG
jgi:uncharacterized Zn finger protein